MSDPTDRPPNFYIPREEIRGLFTLGLLAVVVAVRIQYTDGIILYYDGAPYSVTHFFDWMIVLWSFYAFFMILGTSDDLIGKSGSKLFKKYSIYYLHISFIILGIMAVSFYYSINPLQTTGLSIFVLVILSYWLIKKVYLKVKPIHKRGLLNKSEFFKLFKNGTKNLKSESYQVLASIAGFCLMLIVAGITDDFIIPLSIIGSISLVAFFIVKDRRKKK